MEMFRLTPTFPQDENDQPAHIADDSILVMRPIAHGKLTYEDYKSFVAPHPEAALEVIVNDLKTFLEHVTGEKAV
jgi:hypothetical protein